MKKLILLCVTLLILLSAIFAVPQEKIAEAATGPSFPEIDYDYIKNITYELSQIIRTSYDENELARGREFGSQGEWDAADFLADEMEFNLSLFDPTDEYYKFQSYREKLYNTEWKHRFIFNTHKESCHLQVLSEKLTIRNLTSNTSEEVDCYISPRWVFPIGFVRPGFFILNSHNFSYDYWVDIRHKPSEEKNASCGDFVSAMLEAKFSDLDDFVDDLTENDINDFDSLEEYIIQQLEDYYDFDFDDLENTPWSFPFFNDTCYNASNGFVFIEEDPSFNPDIEYKCWYNRLKKWAPLSKWVHGLKYLSYRARLRIWNVLFHKCIGLIRFDFHDHTHNMERNDRYKLPIIYINGSKGIPINESINNFKIKFHIHQKWNRNVVSYNVIGQINGTDPDKNKTVIVSSLYDSMWCQGTADSAIGCGIVMALAKYMKELENSNIKPKYNVKFILFAGEEFGMKGANHYAHTHKNDTIIAFIDLNQLGFKQPGATDPDLKLNIGTNKIIQFPLIEKITAKTNYQERLPPDDKTGFGVQYYPYGTSGLSNNQAFPGVKSILFLKDSGWTYHHRDGLDHTDGDVIDYYYPEDVNLTTEMVLNVTRFYAYDADCSFKNGVDFEFKNLGGNDNFNDSVSIEYTISGVTNERVMVLAYLQCMKLGHRGKRYSTDGPGVEKREYIIPSPTSQAINDSFTITLPNDAPSGKYRAKVFLFDSRGQIWEEVYNSLHGEYRSIYNSDEHEYSQKTGMVPPIEFPDTPSKPSGPTNVDPYDEYTYTTNATDPNNKTIYYQWAWTYNKTWKGYEPLWIGDNPCSSGSNHSRSHRWILEQQVQVRVRSKNEKYGLSWSNWSEPLNVTVGDGCWFESEDTAIVGHEHNFYGFQTGLEGTVEWKYKFGGGRAENENQNANCWYNNSEDIGEQTINLTVKNTSTTVYFEKNITVVAVKADFNVSSIGAHTNETIVFNDTSLSANNLSNWTWNFGDGHIEYGKDVVHNYSTCGEYTVTLTAKDDAIQTNSSNISKTIYVEYTPPDVLWVAQSDDIIGLGSNITIYADPYDNKSGVKIIKVNITHPDGSYENLTMDSTSNDTIHAYKLVFNNTSFAGLYEYFVYACDSANNSNYIGGRTFNVSHLFGNHTPGPNSQNITDRISGSVFKVLVNGTADNINAYIQTNLSTPPKTKCMIYRNNDSTLIGTTEELTPNTGNDPQWVVFNFSGTKPTLVNDTEYVLTCWSDDTCYLYYGNASAEIGRYNDSTTYESSPPNPVNWTDNETRSYSIYCNYTTTSEITNVSQSKDTVGLGMDVTIDVDVNSHGCVIEEMTVNITHPDNTISNCTMENTGNNVFEYEFDDTWLVGQYNYSIWTVDGFGSGCNSSGHSFNVSTNATISICTIKDEYEENETINLTDPPSEDLPLIGYELLDNGDVLHIWNKYDSYYFNTSSGIQLTNHYNEYWSHNVLMLGYYNNNQWNLIYRTDELSGFNKNIETDNETFVNATLWKDLTYGGYDFRLAIRYYLGVDDNELTVIPYIKNIDQSDIPYILGFGWEMKDIQIDMTTTGDYIDVNGTMYYLNQSLDNTYTDLPESEFYLMENITDTSTKSLYLKWNQSLTYKLQVKSRQGQYNAPVTLFVRIGTLNSGQEKYTKMYWYDKDQVTYYFNSYDNNEAWATNPSYMVDGNGNNYASTTIDGDIELCDGNNCSGSDIGENLKVELRLCAYIADGPRSILLRPVFGGTTDGLNIRYTPSGSAGVWSPWFDITNDPFAPNTWTWTDVDNLDCDVEVENDPFGPTFTMYCCKVEIRVSYTPYNPPGISNPYPANGSTGVLTCPTLNITVSDAEGDSMDITWLSNSSGSWQVFGTNNSVNNGTYHQVFSNASTNAKWWYWKVNVTDGTNYTESDVYKFYTGCQSKVVNTGSYNFKGYLIMNIDYYNDTSEEWELVFEVIDDTSLTTFLWADPFGADGQHIFALDTVFNDLVNTSYVTNYTDYGNGTYRVYVALTDPYGDVLIIDDETELIATHEFTISFE